MRVLKQVLDDYVERLKNNFIENPERDVTLLLSYGLNIPVSELHFRRDQLISHNQLSRLNHLVYRRESNEPIAKIIGAKDFWKSRFLVTRAVLDPRPETELLVETIINYTGKKKNILDLGTGSGCIAISLALELPDVTVVGVDISKAALAIARKNSLRNGAKVSFFQSNWFQNVSEKFDVIVSNPPYISESSYKKLPKDVKNFDPKVALTSGKDGLESYRKIAHSMYSFLKEGGVGFFEIGFGQKKSVIEIFSSARLFIVEVKQDLNGLDRVICVKKDAYISRSAIDMKQA